MKARKLFATDDKETATLRLNFETAREQDLFLHVFLNPIFLENVLSKFPNKEFTMREIEDLCTLLYRQMSQN